MEKLRPGRVMKKGDTTIYVLKQGDIALMGHDGRTTVNLYSLDERWSHVAESNTLTNIDNERYR